MCVCGGGGGTVTGLAAEKPEPDGTGELVSFGQRLPSFYRCSRHHDLMVFVQNTLFDKPYKYV